MARPLPLTSFPSSSSTTSSVIFRRFAVFSNEDLEGSGSAATAGRALLRRFWLGGKEKGMGVVVVEEEEAVALTRALRRDGVALSGMAQLDFFFCPLIDVGLSSPLDSSQSDQLCSRQSLVVEVLNLKMD